MLIRQEPEGLYCEAGGFYIDPTRGVERALITHAHADHARRGSRHYLCAEPCRALLETRLGKKQSIETLAYGETCLINGIQVSFHPAGHVLGSSQIRVSHRDEVWVISGDYKLHPDPTCARFEPVACHHFVSECTFGSPIYQWPSPESQWSRLRQWWQRHQQMGVNSLVLGYSLGKAQRILHACHGMEGPILVHTSIHDCIPAYQAQGIHFPPYQILSTATLRAHDGKALVIAPPSARVEHKLATPEHWEIMGVSGWLMTRTQRRKKGQCHGLIVSDHADWPGLLEAINASQAHTIHLMHGDSRMLEQVLGSEGRQVMRMERSTRKIEPSSEGS
jgi:putative mRNA 3-end processing factor